MKRPLAVVAIALLAAACTSTPVPAGPAVSRISGTMPAVSGTALQGGTVEPSLYRGRPVVLNFWATWCGPCRREQAVLSTAARSVGPNGPVFIGVNFQDDRAAARAFLQQFHVGYPSIADHSGSIAYEFDVPDLPATIFVDANGEMRYRAVGALTTARLDELIAQISPAPASSPSA